MKAKKLEVITYGNEILKQVAKPVTDFNDELRSLIHSMIWTMKAASGIGLAAPQVGISKQLIVILLDSEKGKCLALINPEIVEAEGEISGEEGCLSFPEITGEVKRHARILVKGMNKKGQPVELEGTGLLGRVLQHEIDHLNGVLFTERMSSVRRKLLSKRLKTLKKETLASLAEQQQQSCA